MNRTGILSEAEAPAVLGPYAGGLRACVLEAFGHYTTSVIPVIPALATRTTRANLLHDLILDRMRTRWPDLMHTARRRCFLRVSPQVLLQVKKLNADRLPSNYPTRQALQFAAQRPLQGFPASTRLTLGYSLNHWGTEVTDVTVLCQVSWTYASWYYDLMDDAAPIKQLPLLPQAGTTRRLRAKRPMDRTDDGTDKSQ